MVRKERLELSHQKILVPKTSASTNSATLACVCYFDERYEWGGRWGSNPRQPESQSGALPTELRPPQYLLGAPGTTRTCNPRLRRAMLYPVELRALKTVFYKNGRGREIRTPDPLLPKQLRYQAALYPDIFTHFIKLANFNTYIHQVQS